MRPSDDPSSASSATPIYDALYAEYRRLFRALPGDRSGEESLRFESFGTFHTTGTWDISWGEATGRRRQPPPARTRPAALPPGPSDGPRHGL